MRLARSVYRSRYLRLSYARITAVLHLAERQHSFRVTFEQQGRAAATGIALLSLSVVQSTYAKVGDPCRSRITAARLSGAKRRQGGVQHTRLPDRRRRV